MANENLNIEKKNDTGVKTTMSKEQMEQYVNENRSIVPRNWNKKFEALTLEQKVKKIGFFFDMQKMRNEAQEKNKLENKVKELFIKRKATTEDVVKVIDFCKQYIQTIKEEEINKLQGEIDRLTHLKQSLETN